MRIKLLTKIALFLIVLVSAACSLLPAGEKFPVVSKYFISNVTTGSWMTDAVALSPDGKTIIDQDFVETNLESGDSNRRFGDLDFKYGWGGGGGMMGWSIDGRYLAATQIQFSSDNLILDKPMVLIDTKNNTIRYYKGVFNGWSAVNSDRFMTNNFTPTNVPDGSEIPPWKLIDFRNTAVNGNGNFLWDVAQNVPIAIISSDHILNSSGAETGNRTVEIDSFDKGRTNRLKIYSEKPLQRTVGWVFDPTGRYVLLTIWERSEIPEEGNDEISGENVVDTVLMLVNWRTQEQVELFRLSSLGDGNVTGLLNGTAWSADGSTIFVARKGAPGVVLKVK